jgi:hypothetical protein
MAFYDAFDDGKTYPGAWMLGSATGALNTPEKHCRVLRAQASTVIADQEGVMEFAWHRSDFHERLFVRRRILVRIVDEVDEHAVGKPRSSLASSFAKTSSAIPALTDNLAWGKIQVHCVWWTVPTDCGGASCSVRTEDVIYAHSPHAIGQSKKIPHADQNMPLDCA